MKYSIITEDNTVCSDGNATNDVDLSMIAKNIRAIQWDSEKNIGHIEYNNSLNEEITSFNLIAEIELEIAKAKINAIKKQEEIVEQEKQIKDKNQYEGLSVWCRPISTVNAEGGNNPEFDFSLNDDVIPSISIVANCWVKQMVFKNAGDVHPGHKHKFDHQTLLGKGSIELMVDGNSTIFHAPQIIFIKAGLKHGMVALENETVVYCIHPLRDGDQVGNIIDPANIPNGVTPLTEYEGNEKLVPTEKL